MPDSCKDVIWRIISKSVSIVPRVKLPNFYTFFFLESNKSLCLWDKCNWIAIELLFKSHIGISISVIIDKICDISIGPINFIKLIYYSPLDASMFVPFWNYKRVVLILYSHIFFQLSICISDKFTKYTLCFRDLLIECVHWIIDEWVMNLEWITCIWASW